MYKYFIVILKYIHFFDVLDNLLDNEPIKCHIRAMYYFNKQLT